MKKQSTVIDLGSSRPSQITQEVSPVKRKGTSIQSNKIKTTESTQGDFKRFYQRIISYIFKSSSKQSQSPLSTSKKTIHMKGAPLEQSAKVDEKNIVREEQETILENRKSKVNELDEDQSQLTWFFLTILFMCALMEFLCPKY